MGTLVRIKLFASGEQQAREAFAAAFARIHALDETLSDYAAESELNRLCAVGAGKSVPVSDDLFRVLEASLALSEKTGGEFDITLGPVIRLWRAARKEGQVPDPERLSEASARSGYRHLRLDAKSHDVTLDRSGMQLDVGGIAKGYAADEALAVLREHGITRALVALSGDIAMGDPPPGKSGWKIGVQGSGSEFGAVLELHNLAVSTSGDVEQHVDVDGTRYSHIIDPATRKGLTSGVSATVIAPSGMLSDGYATAVSLLGVSRGVALIDSQEELAALFSVRENGENRLVESAEFRRFGMANIPVAARERSSQ